MKKIDSLHNKAMELAQKAFLVQKNGDEAEFIRLSKEAYSFEKQAAMLLVDKFDTEPNRAILFKSAAFLAYDAKEYKECMDMLINALSGEPDDIIKKELFDLYNEISHLLIPTEATNFLKTTVNINIEEKLPVIC
jgi:hypothetical protein